MSDFKKKHHDQQNNTNNKPQGFKEPHGTPMAPERENQRKDMNNGGKTMNNK
jgi:hypothetical protein